MKRVYQITGMIFLSFSVYIGLEGLSLKYYTSLGPGPGFFPIWLAVALGILSMVLIYQASFKPQEPLPAEFFPSKRGLLRIGAVILSMIWIVAFMPIVGYRIAMAVLLIWLQLSLGKVHPLIMVIVAAAGSWGAFYVFNNLLQVPLPIGFLGF